MNKQGNMKGARPKERRGWWTNKLFLVAALATILLGITAVTVVLAQTTETVVSPNDVIEVSCDGRGIDVERISDKQLNVICQANEQAPAPTPTPPPNEPDPSPPIAAGTYYVAPNGSDQNSGAIDQPFRSIQHAADRAQPGDVVYVRAGTYHEVVTLRNSGTADQPITIAAYPGETPVIDGEYTLPTSNSWGGCNNAVNPPKCYHYKPLVQVRGNHVVVEGFEIKRSLGRGMLVYAPDRRVQHVTVRNNQIHDNRNAGIKVMEADHVLVEGNHVWHSGDYATNDRSGSPDSDAFNPNLGWPIAVSDRRASHVTYRGNHVFENWTEGIGAGLESTDVVVEDNVLYDNRALQIYVQRAQNVVVQRNLAYCTDNPLFWRNDNPPPGIVLNNEVQFSGNQTTKNIKIVNNIVAGCRQNMALWGNKGYTVRNVLVAHNTLVNAHTNDGDQSAVGLVVSNGNVYENVSIVNNLVHQTSGRIASGGSAGGITFGHNLWTQSPPSAMVGGGDVVGDPQLVNPNGTLAPGAVQPDWYALQGSSIAIDQATAVTEVSVDFFGTARTTPDIGSYEFAR